MLCSATNKFATSRRSGIFGCGFGFGAPESKRVLATNHILSQFGPSILGELRGTSPEDQDSEAPGCVVSLGLVVRERLISGSAWSMLLLVFGRLIQEPLVQYPYILQVGQ